jgi:hypothetical protein
VAVSISSLTTNTNDGTSATISVTTSESPVTTQVGDLVVVIHGNNFYALSNMPTPTATGSPTLTNIVDADGGTNQGHIRAWYYYANTGGAQTVSVTETGAHDEEKDLAVFVLTGAASSSPIDGAASGFSTTDAQPVCPSISPATSDAYLIAPVQSGGAAGPGGYTPPGSLTEKYDVTVGQLEAAGGIAQLVVSGATGTFTWTNGVNRPYASATFAIKTAQTAASGGPPPTLPPWLLFPIIEAATAWWQTSGPDLSALAPAPILVVAQAQLLPPAVVSVSAAQIPQATGILTSPATVVPGQFRPATVAPIVLTPPPLPQAAAPITVAAQATRQSIVGPVVLTPPFLPPQAIPPFVLVAAQQFSPPTVDPIVIGPPFLPSGQPVPLAPFWINPSRPQPPLASVVSITPPPLPQAPAPISINPARSQPPLAAVITLVPAPLPQAPAPIVVVTSTWRPRPLQISVSQPGFPVAAVPVLAPAPIAVVRAYAARPVIRPLALTPPPLPVVAAGISLDGRNVTAATSARVGSSIAGGRSGSATVDRRTTTTTADGRTVSIIEGRRS